ncbi:MAG: hypothetical protein ACYC1Q_07790 [Bacteroidia bacterium]
MKALFSIFLFLLIATTACNNAPVEDEKPAEENAPMDSKAFMNAYVDSINVLADSLQRVYNKVLDIAPRSMDSAKMMMAAVSPNIEGLKTELNRLTTEVGNLMEKKWISEDDYQNMFHDIRLGAAEGSEQTLDLLGLHSPADSSTQTN